MTVPHRWLYSSAMKLDLSFAAGCERSALQEAGCNTLGTTDIIDYTGSTSNPADCMLVHILESNIS